ncbi:superoxide dismutase family protein [Metabacillus idriensis]|uniref:superoxide dismutase family protein n=1 Tax=Metabacillus idriensis TaxID=324768 RepID=UPI002812F7E5|nr:superoxide dismutase family protein [Metabacillus idriensis]MDR0137698.1 superoxide dismutase family protein [Metabacillus idriensis]
MNRKSYYAVIITALLSLSACQATAEIESEDESLPVSEKAVAPENIDIINSEGVQIGTAALTETSKGVTIRLKAEGLEPGKKAIHLHETGKCEKPDFKSAGGHFNPAKKQHGFDNPKGFHAGDLPNIEIDENGTVDVELHAAEVTLKQGKKNSLLDEDGSSIIIHEKEDDYMTDPAGNAGNRIACGAIVN